MKKIVSFTILAVALLLCACKKEDILRESKIYIEKLYSYNEAGKISIIRKYGQLLSEEYVAEGIEVKAYVPVEIYDKVQ